MQVLTSSVYQTGLNRCLSQLTWYCFFAIIPTHAEVVELVDTLA